MKGWPSASGLVGLGLALAVGCGGPPREPASATAEAPPGSEAPAPDEPAAEAPLSEAECMAALDHFIEVAMAEMQATLPPEQVPTGEQVAGIRETMRTEFLPTCVGGARTGYDCTMQATTSAAIESCLQEEAP